MCRWFIYYGENISLKKILIDPENSIIKQSYSKKFTPYIKNNWRDNKINVDGYGIGFLFDDKNYFLYKSTDSPWNDNNLKNIIPLFKTKLFFGHVRAIKPELNRCYSFVHQVNCHPFKYKDYMWIHNGNIKNFCKIKLDIIKKIKPQFISLINGNTDSEYVFYLFLTFLEKNRNLKKTMMVLINYLSTFLKNKVSSMNFAVTDKKNVIATRYINSDHEDPPSLYYKLENKKIYISSEPIDYIEKGWTLIKKNVMISIDKKLKLTTMYL